MQLIFGFYTLYILTPPLNHLMVAPIHSNTKTINTELKRGVFFLSQMREFFRLLFVRTQTYFAMRLIFEVNNISFTNLFTSFNELKRKLTKKNIFKRDKIVFNACVDETISFVCSRHKKEERIEVKKTLLYPLEPQARVDRRWVFLPRLSLLFLCRGTLCKRSNLNGIRNFVLLET